jgi:hypothetical protein
MRFPHGCSFQRKRCFLIVRLERSSRAYPCPCLLVLLYLEGMETDPPEPDHRESLLPLSPRSQHTSPPTHIPSPLMKSGVSAGRLGPRSARSELSYMTDKRNNAIAGDSKSVRNDEVRSDIQEARESDLGTTVPIRTTDHVSMQLLCTFPM